MAQSCENQHGAQRRQGFLLMSGLTLLLAASSAVEAQQPADFFRQNCMSCHTIGGGRKTVGAWLSAPPTPTMQAVFKQHPLLPEESFALLAGVEDASGKGHLADSAPVLKFFLLGFGGMSLGLILLQVAWRGRLRAVRRPLVHARERGEP